MLDMMGVTSEERASDAEIEHFKKDLNLETRRIAGTNYENVLLFSHNGEHKFSLSSEPRASFCKDYSIQINPSRYNNHQEVSGIVHRLLGEEATFNRLDFCSDLPLPLEFIESRLRVRNKIKATDYHSGKITGMYFGSPKYDLIAVYDRGYLLDKKHKKLNRDKSYQFKTLTRIEVRKRTSKLPFKSFSEASHYIDYNPFHQVEIVEFADETNVKPRQRARFKFFMEYCKDVGFNMAYKDWNTSNNFNKTLGKNISLSHLNNQLIENHKNELINYFGGSYE